MRHPIRVYLHGHADQADDLAESAAALLVAGYLVALPDFSPAESVADLLDQVRDDHAALAAADVVTALPGDEWTAVRLIAGLYRRPVLPVAALLAAAEAVTA
ncbi:hypothetical protein Nm8I071_66530 [Nonomuraea sp. TT08I-71]|nr:hypothetical protein Nm8I071_66530 [Nonomuraea sp. TT08I-71]